MPSVRLHRISVSKSILHLASNILAKGELHRLALPRGEAKARTRAGARNASEIVMLTWRTLRF
jgi:hypothetical protein